MSRTKGTDSRRRFSPDEKATILRRHLVARVAVSDLCDEYRIQPNVFYLWRRQAVERWSEMLQRSNHAGADAGSVGGSGPRGRSGSQARAKDAIIADIAAEHLSLKKTWGELRNCWVPPDLRDTVVDYVRAFSTRTELRVRTVLAGLALSSTAGPSGTGVTTHNGRCNATIGSRPTNARRSWPITPRTRRRATDG